MFKNFKTKVLILSLKFFISTKRSVRKEKESIFRKIIATTSSHIRGLVSHYVS